MSDQDMRPVPEQPTLSAYQSVLPELGRLLLSQHCLSVDGKVVTVDEFAAVVEKSTSLIQSMKVFLQLQVFRPDYIQFLIDREAWETFCGGPSQKENPSYRPFPSKDPRIDSPLPQYFDPGALTPDSYGIIYRDDVHPEYPNCSCGNMGLRPGLSSQCLCKDGGTRVGNPKDNYNAWKERLEERSRKEGFANSDELFDQQCREQQAKDDELARIKADAVAFAERHEADSKKGGFKHPEERWEKECEIYRAKDAGPVETKLEGKNLVDLHAKNQIVPEEKKSAEQPERMKKKKDKRWKKRFSECSIM